ncbi:MAG: two-component system sensor histidine kinase NtrB, partial [Candidatus Binatia bacterium]
VMRSAAQLLERSLESKDSETKELLLMLREEVDRIDHVVTGLLELGRPRELTLEPVPLGQVVFRAADFAEMQAREHGVVIRRVAAEPDPTALCDPELVYQVVLNLLVNALQILSAGGQIEIAVARPAGGVVGFHVRDDGPGIPEAIREKIFQPFFSQRAGGAGLGLTFVQRVVQEHRGRVTVESTPGRGTTFRIELPAA